MNMVEGGGWETGRFRNHAGVSYIRIYVDKIKKERTKRLIGKKETCIYC